MYSPQKVCDIMVVSCILHNLATRDGIPLDEEEENCDEGEREGIHLDTEQGRQIRQRIVQDVFA